MERTVALLERMGCIKLDCTGQVFVEPGWISLSLRRGRIQRTLFGEGFFFGMVEDENGEVSGSGDCSNSSPDSRMLSTTFDIEWVIIRIEGCH